MLDLRIESFVLFCGYKIFTVPIIVSILVDIHTDYILHHETSKSIFIYIATYFNVCKLLNEWIDAIDYKFITKLSLRIYFRKFSYDLLYSNYDW